MIKKPVKQESPLTIIPDPKYLAKLRHIISRHEMHQHFVTHSKRPFGTCNHEDLLARTGNNAPNVEPARIIKTAATRRPKNVSAPPPEPQFSASVSGVSVGEGRPLVEDILAYRKGGKGSDLNEGL